MAISRSNISKEISRGPSKKKNKMKTVMGEYKKGTLRSGSKKGPKVKSRKQAIAIALSESRKGKRKKKHG
tara:strand:+ start:330 stop:539 length:210 start_codon:yes stop_codon:yes gene_type:complete